MKAQPSIKQYPVAIFKLAAVFFVLLPLLVTSVIFYIGQSNNRTYVEIWTLFIELELTMHLYNLGCIAIAVVLWNLRLIITPQKIYYSVWNIPITLGIQKHEIYDCRINHQFDAPLTWMLRQVKTFDSTSDLDAFDRKMGTIEFVFIHQQPINWLRHKFSLMYLLSFSKQHRHAIVQMLQDHWKLKFYRDS